MRRADLERIRQMAEAKSPSLQWHFVDAPQEVRPRPRVADWNTAKGETFVMEVTPQRFDMLEAIYDPPAPAELEGAVLSASAMTRRPPLQQRSVRRAQESHGDMTPFTTAARNEEIGTARRLLPSVTV